MSYNDFPLEYLHFFLFVKFFMGHWTHSRLIFDSFYHKICSVKLSQHEDYYYVTSDIKKS